MRQVRLSVVGRSGDLLEHAGERIGRYAGKSEPKADRRSGFARRRLRRVRPLGHQRVDLVNERAEIVVQPITRVGERDRDLGGDSAGIGREHENSVSHQNRFLDIMGDHQDGFDRYAPFLPKIEQVGAQGLGGEHVER